MNLYDYINSIIEDINDTTPISKQLDDYKKAIRLLSSKKAISKDIGSIFLRTLPSINFAADEIEKHFKHQQDFVSSENTLLEELLYGSQKIDDLINRETKNIHDLYHSIQYVSSAFFMTSYISSYEYSKELLAPTLNRLEKIFSSGKSCPSLYFMYTSLFDNAVSQLYQDVQHDPRVLLDFYNAGLVSKSLIFKELDFNREDLEIMLRAKLPNKNDYVFSNPEIIDLYRNNHINLKASDIASRQLSISDFGFDATDFQDVVTCKNGLYPDFQIAFQKNPSIDRIPDMFFLLDNGFLDANGLPEIYKAIKSLDPEIANRSFLHYLNLYNLNGLCIQGKLSPETKKLYENLFEDKEERIKYEKSQLLKHADSFSIYPAIGLGFSLLDYDLILPESLGVFISPENAPEMIIDYNLSPSNIAKLYSSQFLDNETLSLSLSIKQMVTEKERGNLKFDPEKEHLDLSVFDRASVFIGYENGLVSNSDILPYVSEDTATIPKSSLMKLYSNKLVENSILGERFSQDELLDMYLKGDIGIEVLGLLSDSTRESAHFSKAISSEEFFKGYEKDYIELESLVSLESGKINFTRYISSETPSSKIGELFANDLIPYSDLKKLEAEGLITSEEKDTFVSEYDITPSINKLLENASIKYNTYKPEHSIDPEELLITLGAEEIIPVTDDFNFAYIPEHNTGILYETTNYSNYIGTSNKTYTLELLDALEVIKTKSFQSLPTRYPYISATANYGTELLESIHSIDHTFEYQSNPDISDYIEDIRLQVTGMDRDED